MNTAREPKQEDTTETDPLDSRRGMRLVRDGRKAPKPLRIAISNDLFSMEPRRPTRNEPSPGKVTRGLTHHSAINDRRVRADKRTNRVSGSRALVIAIAVTASGFVLKYLWGDRRKD